MQPFQTMPSMGQVQPMQQMACVGPMQPTQPMQPMSALQPVQQTQPMSQMFPVPQPYVPMNSPPTNPQVVFYPVLDSQRAHPPQQAQQSLQPKPAASSKKQNSKSKSSKSSRTRSSHKSRSRSRSRGRRHHRTSRKSRSRGRRHARTKSKSKKDKRAHSKSKSEKTRRAHSKKDKREHSRTKSKYQRRPKTPEKPIATAGPTTTADSQQTRHDDPTWDEWGSWDSSEKNAWPKSSYQSWYGQRSYHGYNTAQSSKGDYRRQGQEKGKGKGQRQGRGQNKSYGHPQAGYQPKGGSSGKSQEKGKKKDKSYRDRTSSPNSLPLGQRTASRSRAPEDKDSRAADFDDYNYWSQAIHKARADTSRIPILAEMLPDQIEPPRAIDQDEVQTISSIIQVKDTEVPENISQHMAEILLTKIPCEDLTEDNFSYLEMTDEGIGCTLANISQFIETAPVFGMPPDFSGDRHNMFHYVFAHGTDVKSAKMIMTQGVIRPYTWNPQDATDFPSFGFYGLGAVGAFSPHLTTQLLKKIWKISKGKQGVVILGEVTSTKEHGTLESGGTTDEQHLVRRKAVVKGKERWCFHSAHAHIQAIVMMRPI